MSHSAILLFCCVESRIDAANRLKRKIFAAKIRKEDSKGKSEGGQNLGWQKEKRVVKARFFVVTLGEKRFM